MANDGRKTLWARIGNGVWLCLFAIGMVMAAGSLLGSSVPLLHAIGQILGLFAYLFGFVLLVVGAAIVLVGGALNFRDVWILTPEGKDRDA